MSDADAERGGLPRRVCAVTVGRVLVIAVTVPACFHPAYDRPTCGAHGECPSGLSCSTQNICEGKMEEADGGTAAIDMALPDARACFGDAPFTVCLAAAPTAPLTLTTMINTDTSSLCVATTSGGIGSCVVAGTTITVNSSEGPTLRATGSKPLVLVASDSITFKSPLDVSSHHTTNPATNPETGAGADFSGCPSPATNPANGGGGAGGSFTGPGGTGAAAARGGSLGGSPGAGLPTVTALRGGCPGQDGEGAPADLGKGGHGGGAVLLIAGNSINVMAEINASGEGGRAGNQNSSGGGGGGAGGMIVLDARTVTNSALLLANGGGGGEGSGENSAGGDGSDPTTTTAAAGGSTTANGGDGGAGSAGIAAGAGRAGLAGTIVNALHGGGGAGGGGAGIILVPSGITLGGTLSPLATTF